MIHKGQPGAKSIVSALMMVPVTFWGYFELIAKEEKSGPKE